MYRKNFDELYFFLKICSSGRRKNQINELIELKTEKTLFQKIGRNKCQRIYYSPSHHGLKIFQFFQIDLNFCFSSVGLIAE